MDTKEATADPAEQSSPSTLAPPTAVPMRRRSKLACDTCHYRKIKCDVEKGLPCKNCERNAVQCTLVGPTMRPPRNISGSTSAAAAAAVAVAMATAAAATAGAQPGVGMSFNGQSSENSISNGYSADQSRKAWDQSTSSPGDETGSTRVPGLLVRRASASGQLMRVDEAESSSNSADAGDNTKRRRSLMSSSSSPTSLRALFNAGATVVRSPTSASSQAGLQTAANNATNPLEGVNQGAITQDATADATGLAGNTNGLDYFDQSVAYSENSSSSSTPSGAMIMSGMTHFGFPVDPMSSTVAHLISPLSSPLCHAQTASLPPTPLHIVAERLPESIMAGSSTTGLGRYAPGHAQFQIPTSHSRHGAPRRASSSSYLPSNHSMDSDIKLQQHDKRTSAPWTSYSHSPSLPYDSRHLTQVQPGSSGVQGQHYGAIHSHIKSHATTEDIQPYPTQSALMRSNSTPAALRSPLKSLTRNRHSALPSRRSHIVPTRPSLNLYASTDKFIQDLSLPQQLYRHSALPQRHNSNMSHLQFQLHLQQLQQSQQHSQRSQSLPRFQTEQTHRSPLQQQQQAQQNMLPWQQYGVPQQLQQKTDLYFDLSASNSQADLAMGSKSVSMAHSTHQESENFRTDPSADVLSPVGVHSHIQSTAADLQSFTGHMNTAIDPSLAGDIGSSSGMGSMRQHELLAQQQIHNQPSLEEQTPKLQFTSGCVWNPDGNPDRITHGHTRHQSASQVYSQQPLQFQSSTDQRVNWTRSLQDLTHYTIGLVDQQQRLADHTQLLHEEAPTVRPPTLDQNGLQDSFGASLALVLDDNLRLLDDMDVVPELNEYEEIPQPSLTTSTLSSKNVLLQSTGMPTHPDHSLVGSTPAAVLNHQPLRPIFGSIAGTTPGTQGILLNGANISNPLGQGTEILQFQGDPYIDTLSFLDLSGTFMTSTAAAASSSASTSSSLPNTSFLDHQGDRLYQGFVPNLQQQQQPLAPNFHSTTVQPPQGHHQPPPPLPQQHIIHHQHHHHHHHHIH